MVISLQKVSSDGKPYKRRKIIEDLLKELEPLEPQQLVDRSQNPDSIMPYEVLVYYLRHKELALKEKYYQPLFTSFYTRVESYLNRSIPNSRVDRAKDIREEIISRILKMIALDRNKQEDKMYYWEVNFNHALANLCKDVLEQMGPSHISNPLGKALPLIQDTETDLRPEIEAAATEFLNPNSSKLDDLDFRSRLMAAINSLPKDEQRVVGLMLEGMQIDSKKANVMTISKALGCTDRTIRNRLTRAYNKLRVTLQEEEL